jgi:hypothetical protein
LLRLEAVVLLCAATLLALPYSPSANASTGFRFSWTPTGIPARDQATMAFDAASGTTVLFGGSGGVTLSRDTWTFDGSAWTPQSPTHSPQARELAAMAYDAANQQVVLFGGFNGGAFIADTWTWDGSDWTEQTPAHSPQPRGAAGMTYDVATGTVVLFGGVTDCSGTCNQTDLGDTWTWDGTDWTERTPVHSPAAQHYLTMAYDGDRQQVVLVGQPCCGQNDPAETWTWDGTDWTERTPTHSPPRRDIASMADDAAHQQVVLFGGAGCSLFCSDTWTWDGTDWTEQTPPHSPSPRYVASIVFDSLRGNVLLFGGYSSSPWGGFSDAEVMGDWWTWDGSDWTQQSPGTVPSERRSPAMAYDEARQDVMLFGGEGFHDTWTWDGATWTPLSPAHSPSPRYRAAAAYDAAHQQIVLFGGTSGAVLCGDGDCEDTWTWDGSDWTERTPAHSPPARESASAAYDAATQTTVLFGGAHCYNPGNGYRCDPFGDTWTWDGTDWTEQTPVHSPPARMSSSMAYDVATGDVVLFGGTGDGCAYCGDDTWSWDGADWTQRTPAHTPPGRTAAAMAYDPGSQTVVLFGGAGCGYLCSDTWTWDGTDWTEQFPDESPPGRDSAAMAFDPNGSALLFGGVGPDPGSSVYSPTPDVVAVVGDQGTDVATTNAPGATLSSLTDRGGEFTTEVPSTQALSMTHPLATSVTVGDTPGGGMVTIAQTHPTETAPHGYAFLDAQSIVVAPRGSPDSPLTLLFWLHPSLISGAPVDVFRTEGVRAGPQKIASCLSEAPPSPDPCASSESTTPAGALKITVLTTSASTWDFAFLRPDAKIKLGSESSYVGSDVYNATGTHQTRVVKAKRKTTKTFDIAVQNRRTAVDAFQLKGLGSTKDFTVKYFAGLTGTTDITAAVRAGTYTLRNVAPDGTKYIRMRITVNRSANIGSTFRRLIKATSIHASVANDAVKGGVRVIR